jgi:hypothetical protein
VTVSSVDPSSTTNTIISENLAVGRGIDLMTSPIVLSSFNAGITITAFMLAIPKRLGFAVTGHSS